MVQIWPGLFVCKQVTVCPGHIWTTLYKTVRSNTTNLQEVLTRLALSKLMIFKTTAQFLLSHMVLCPRVIHCVEHIASWQLNSWPYHKHLAFRKGKRSLPRSKQLTITRQIDPVRKTQHVTSGSTYHLFTTHAYVTQTILPFWRLPTNIFYASAAGKKWSYFLFMAK